MDLSTVVFIGLIVVGATLTIAHAKNKDMGKWTAYALCFGIVALAIVIFLPSDPPRPAGRRGHLPDGRDELLAHEIDRAKAVRAACDDVICEVERIYVHELPRDPKHPGLRTVYLDACTRTRRGSAMLERARTLGNAGDILAARSQAHTAYLELDAARISLWQVRNLLFPERFLEGMPGTQLQ